MDKTSSVIDNISWLIKKLYTDKSISVVYRNEMGTYSIRITKDLEMCIKNKDHPEYPEIKEPIDFDRFFKICSGSYYCINERGIYCEFRWND